MIERMKYEVEERYCIKNGYSYDVQVIYGDIDFVMVKFGIKELVEVMKFGEDVVNYVFSKFIKFIKFEFEKVYFFYFLINKKCYVGLYWIKLEKYDKMDIKGIEIVCCDNCFLV